jgi:hypothetical protein
VAPLPPIATAGAAVNAAIQAIALSPHWVCWRSIERKGKPTKVPFTPAGSPASSTDPRTWSTFGECFTAAFVEGKFDGIGFVFTDADGLVGLDLDDCLQDGEPSADARQIISRFGSYAEISPSGNGVKLIARGKLPEPGRRNGKLELYSSKRFFTITGQHLPGSPERINAAQPAIDELWAKHFAKPRVKASGQSGTLPPYPLQAEINALLRDDRTADDYWQQKFTVCPKDDQSPSAWDLAFAGYLARQGYDRETVGGFLRAYRKHHEPGKGKQDRADYIWATVDQALGDQDDDDQFTPDDQRLTQQSWCEESEESEERSWPAALADDAFHGLAGAVVRAIEPHSEADSAALLLQFLAAFGNACGRGPYVPIEGDQHPPQIWVILVGETSKARKGTSWGRVRQLFDLACPYWAKERVLSGLSSGEGVIHQVRDRVTERRKNKDGSYDEVEIDPGIADKRLLVLEPEFGSSLRHMERVGNTLSGTLRCLWDRGDVQALTKNSPSRTTGSLVSILGHVTVEELKRYLTRTELANGLANRFLFACCRRSKKLPFGGGEIEVQELADQVGARLTRLGKRTDQRIYWSDDAKTIWAEIYSDLSEGAPGMFGAVTSRAEAQTLRLAAVYALLDGVVYIEPAHLRAALAVWKYCNDSALYLFGTSLGDPVADEIRRALRVATHGLSRWDISNLLGRHQSADAIGRALELLAKRGLARCEMKATRGRPEERWFAG